MDFNGQVGWRYIGAEDLLALLQARRPISTELKLTGQATVETFDFRRVLIGRMSDEYMQRAEQRVASALEPLFGDRERTLQRLSATFRRADLVDTLLEAGGEGNP